MPKDQNEIRIIIIAGTALFLFLAGILIIIGTLYQKKRQKFIFEGEMLKIRHKEELLKMQLEIQEQTFKNISQEIHDNIGQVLSLAKLNLNTINSPETDKLNNTRQLVAKAISDLRELSRSLHGERIAEIGLQAALQNELKILGNSGHFDTHINVSGTPFTLPAQTQTVLFRIVQESLQNAVKHSKAKRISILFDYRNDNFSLCVADDGVGFLENQLKDIEKGIGLKNMKNRASIINAELLIKSEPGNGTKICVTLPVEKEVV